jgi:hypothetical protein
MTPAVALALVTWLFFRVFLNMPGSERLAHEIALKEQRRQDCARRHCGSYRGRLADRQRFPAAIRRGPGIGVAQVSCWRGCISKARPVSPAGLEANRQQGDA